MKILWKGRIPLSKIEWSFNPSNEHLLSDNLETQREHVWTEMITKFPETYDGDVLILDDFQISVDKIIFNLGFMKFSRILTLQNLKQHPPGYGCLGMQAIILSHDGRSVLAGQRAESLPYCPSFYAVPGGILEVMDTKGNFESACMREFDEEISLSLQPEKYLIGILQELHGTVGVVALITAAPLKQIDYDREVDGNDEWSHRQLRWYPVSQLENITFKNSLEGLLFLKDDWDRFTQNRRSVFWK